MAMKMTTDGIGELEDMLKKLGDKAYSVAAQGLYSGAGVMAEAYANAVNDIKAEPQRKKNPPPEKTPARYPTPEEKAALQGKTGISSFKRDLGEVNTLVGIGRSAGYCYINGRKKPVLLIARSINRGTSFMHKQPVFRRAFNQTKESAQNAIIATAEEKQKEIING